MMRLLWTEPEASFAGEFFNFENIVTSPKPLQQPHPRMVVGGNRPPALRRAARFGDGWHPMNVSPEGVARRLETIREVAGPLGRDGVANTVQVRLDMSRVNKETVAEYEAAGVTDLVMSLQTGDVAKQEAELERFANDMF